MSTRPPLLMAPDFSDDEVARDCNANTASWCASPRFDRTRSEYLDGVIAAGFTLARIEEPRPSEAYCLAHPSQRGWRDHAALHVRATEHA